MKEIKLIQLLASKDTKVTRIKSEVYKLVEERCKDDNMNTNVFISNAILEKLEKEGKIRLI